MRKIIECYHGHLIILEVTGKKKKKRSSLEVELIGGTTRELTSLYFYSEENKEHVLQDLRRYIDKHLKSIRETLWREVEEVEKERAKRKDNHR